MSTYNIKERTNETVPAVELKEIKLEERAFASETDEIGICVTCDHRSTCLFMKASRRPVWFCDEFISVESDRKTESSVTSKATDKVESLDARLMGLCANCEEVKNCKHRTDGVAVLNCEDYR